MNGLPDRSALTGRRIGVYQVLELLGAGGMGEVYRAHDTRLGRDVAIKILPPAFTADPDRLVWFEREARILATLNHAYIGSIYGVEDIEPASGSGGSPTRALVLELVDGPTLADRLRSGPLPIAEALSIARQVADALEAAHGKGIIHRDLKPANIKVRPDGAVKVLDFGLAKDAAGRGPMSDPSESPTVTMSATRDGVILGTAAYMSPEQANARPVDKRADLWAFGAVLYETLTGSRAFGGDTVADTLARVLMKEPNWDALPADTPTAIRRLLRRCLEKNPQRRLADVADARLEIDDALAPPVAGTTPPLTVPRRRTALVAIPALVGGAVIAGFVVWAVMRAGPEAPSLSSRFTIAPPPTQPLEISSYARDIALSPDGRYLVYRSRGPLLMLRALDRLEAEPLPGTAGAEVPFFSPDSRWIGFLTRGELKKVSVSGGPVTVLSRNLGSVQSAAWGDDGTIVFGTENTNTGCGESRRRAGRRQR